MKKKDIKYIEPKLHDAWLMSSLQDWVLENTNAGLISIELSRHCKSFIKGLRGIPLSDEYQSY